MSKELLLKALVCSAAIATLIGSGTTGGSDGSSLQTLSQAHANHTTLSGKANTIYYSPSTGVAIDSNSKTISIMANNSGGYDASINGVSYTFSPSEWDATNKQYVKYITPTNALVFTTAKEASGGAFAYKYTDLVVAGEFNTATNYSGAGFGTYGIKTEAMPAANSVTLSGKATAFVSARNNTSLNNALVGNITLNANFSTSKISGSITNISDVLTANTYPGQLNIEDSAITHNTYQANITGSTAFNNSIGEAATGKLDGGFYGPDAAETSGTFTLSTPNYVGIGGYIAKK